MVRIRNAAAAHKRKKRVLKRAKGQFGHRSTRYRQAKRSVVKGMTYSYRDRKVRAREFRSLWIIRISAACKENGTNYSRFMNGLKRANVDIDRKMLSEIAVHSPSAFKKLVKLSKDGVQSKPKAKEKAAAAKE